MENIFHQRRIFSAGFNDAETDIPIIVAATSEELTTPDNHFSMPENEKRVSRLQPFIKKGKMYAYNNGQPVAVVTGLAGKTITIFGRPQALSPASIMQNENYFYTLSKKANEYLEMVLKVPTGEEKGETHLQVMVDRLYQVIKKSSPSRGEIVHLATMERDLSSANAGKNRLTAAFSMLILGELRERISRNKDIWQVELDRVLALKQRTSRAESFGIHRIAQQALMLYQPREAEEKIISREKVIILDDHIQAGAAMYSAASEVMNSDANLIAITCISAHENSRFFNIHPDVIRFLENLLPNGADDFSVLDDILKHAGLSIKTLTNIEGMILIAILCDPFNQEQRDLFESLLKKYDASGLIGHSLFKSQINSLRAEFDKPQVAFADFEAELLLAIRKGRYTVPCTQQTVLSDEQGQNIAKAAAARTKLPWLLFDFDDTLHHLGDSTYIIFQGIIKMYAGVEIPVETITQTRLTLKAAGEYQYQQMLLSFIKQFHPKTQISLDDITNAYRDYKYREPFVPKIGKADFLALRSRYRIGIITDGSAFQLMVPKISAFYGVDIDGYVHHEEHLLKKPDAAMFHEFCRIYDVREKPVVYVGDRGDLDGGMAKNTNMKFISVDPAQPMLDMKEFTEKLKQIEAKKKIARDHWKLFKSHFDNSLMETKSKERVLR